MAMVVDGFEGARADINVAPLIDVLLVLLIIFMVITPLVPHGLDILVPQLSSDQPTSQGEDSSVVIEINKDQDIEINGQSIKEADLQSRLTDIFRTRATKVVFVKGDPELDYRYVAQAIDDAKGAGLDRVGIMTSTEELKDKRGNLVL